MADLTFENALSVWSERGGDRRARQKRLAKTVDRRSIGPPAREEVFSFRIRAELKASLRAAAGTRKGAIAEWMERAITAEIARQAEREGDG